MARKYTYTDFRTGYVLFETTQPNYVSDEDVDKMVLQKTGRDPRIERGMIERQIRSIAD